MCPSRLSNLSQWRPPLTDEDFELGLLLVPDWQRTKFESKLLHCLLYDLRAGTRLARGQAQAEADRPASASLATCWYETGRLLQSGKNVALCPRTTSRRGSHAGARLAGASVFPSWKCMFDLCDWSFCWYKTGKRPDSSQPYSFSFNIAGFLLVQDWQDAVIRRKCRSSFMLATAHSASTWLPFLLIEDWQAAALRPRRRSSCTTVSRVRGHGLSKPAPDFVPRRHLDMLLGQGAPLLVRDWQGPNTRLQFDSHQYSSVFKQTMMTLASGSRAGIRLAGSRALSTTFYSFRGQTIRRLQNGLVVALVQDADTLFHRPLAGLREAGVQPPQPRAAWSSCWYKTGRHQRRLINHGLDIQACPRQHA
ncbi:hypothetical protein TgHK011_000213 [Trichoderma gracile]|nr:hypothetical protein TgHK011_000213 [Trichoderma gracile]